MPLRNSKKQKERPGLEAKYKPVGSLEQTPIIPDGENWLKLPINNPDFTIIGIDNL